MRFVADAMATWAVGTAFFLGNLFPKSSSSTRSVFPVAPAARFAKRTV
jgi:uncharacterized membrane protein YgdD (TMEM256/DUF423 family)